MLMSDSGQGESLCTPRRVQKRLFGPGDSTGKRNMFREQRAISPDSGASGEESDLGPMSPLALSDQSPSSIHSSPSRSKSLLATPNDTPRSRRHISWDRLFLICNGNNCNDSPSPFSALKRLTHAARSSPRRKIFPDTSKSPTMSTSERKLSGISPPSTPKRAEKILNNVIPETPRRSFGRVVQNGVTLESKIVAETPQKDDSPEHRLITPLGSVSKEIPLPRVHRRKSVNAVDSNEGSSPERKENTLKRRAHDVLSTATSKLFKSDDNSSIPKARAALFQENKKEEFKFSTKSFYGTLSKKSKRERPFDIEWRSIEETKKRRSLPAHNTNHKRTLKRRKLGEINVGVFHGIRRPKRKTRASKSESSKSEEKDTSLPCLSSKDDTIISETFEESTSPIIQYNINELSFPEIDPNKKFFKTNRTLEPNRSATITVNNKIKLHVSNGKIALNQKKPRCYGNARKKPRLTDLTFDTTDLTIDESELNVTLDQDNVTKILKMLEDDWAEDNYDTMGPVMNNSKIAISPMKSMIISKDVMSPASELSNMTSVMNIKDVAGPTDFENILNNNNLAEVNEEITNQETDAQKKYYPLFTKGYTPSNIFENANDKKGTRGTKRCVNWQMSVKTGGNENQYQLDAGQIRFGATQCTECGVVYQLGDPQDENAHLNYHNSIKILKFPGWKKERVIIEDPYTSSRIILIEPEDSKQCWKKVSDILAIIDNDLGLSEMKLPDILDKKVYMYIRDKSVLGILVAEYLRTAHRIIPELSELDCCSMETTPVKCGINVIWTVMSHRRQGIATKLIDTLRTNFFFGYMMSVDDIAFSTPTPTGKIFAEKYTKTKNFKVYS